MEHPLSTFNAALALAAEVRSRSSPPCSMTCWRMGDRPGASPSAPPSATAGVPDATGLKPPWRARKEAYLAHLRAATGPGLLVSACDKLTNLQAILLDLTEIGEAVWERFTAGKEGSLWYYASLVNAFAGRVPLPLERALHRDWAAVRAICSPR